jgi:hypothetical protein
MKWEEIIEKFKNEWVLISIKEVDEAFNIKEGDVIAHSKEKEEIYKKLLELRPTKFSIEFTGKIPEDLSVVLSHGDI